MQPEKMSLLDPGTAAATDYVNIERIVWFTTQAPPASLVSSTTTYFYNRGAAGSATLGPGRYAVVGPRNKTWLGSQQDGSVLAQTTPAWAPCSTT